MWIWKKTPKARRNPAALEAGPLAYGWRVSLAHRWLGPTPAAEGESPAEAARGDTHPLEADRERVPEPAMPAAVA